MDFPKVLRPTLPATMPTATPEHPEAMPLLDVRDLSVSFVSGDRRTEAVKGISFSVRAGETVAIVGESGSGKSVTALALGRLLPPAPACEVSGSVRLAGRELSGLSGREWQAVRGRGIAYVFQEPMASMNPSFTVGWQIAEALRLHGGPAPARGLRSEVERRLADVGIRDTTRVADAHPHEISGGMCQRAMIAMALACGPSLLVADEPTTALDTTVQKQIMELLASLRRERGMTQLLITHNFGIVNGFADRVVVMFRGRIVEEGPTAAILAAPRHPYTRALIDCIPRRGSTRRRLPTLDGDALARQLEP